MNVVTLSSKGQIVIPSKIRKKLSLKEGDSLVVLEENDSIRLVPRVNISDLWGVDTLQDARSILSEIRREWDRELEEKTSL